MNNNDNQEKVFQYFETEATQKKGLLLYGPAGTGKTTAIRPYQERKWAMTSINLSMETSKNGRNYLEKYSVHDMIIDDLGREPISVKTYGDEIFVLHDLLYIRYNAFMKGYKTHITTNLSFNQLKERYGEAIMDRIKEMCDVIEFKGQSLRV